jgi:catechol 2,3-dioxygenase
MQKSIDPNTTLAYVHLTVSDFKRSLPFYQDVLGLQLNRREYDTVYLGAGGKDILVLTENPSAKRAPRTTGLYHFAILVPSRFVLAQSLKRIAEMQVPVHGFADHLVSEAIYLPDPDENGIEIYRDRPRNEWYDARGNLRMATDPLDLDDLIRELDGRDEPWRGFDPETKLGHMHLHVAHIAAAEKFYVDVLGFDLMARYGPSASFTSAGGYHHHIAFNTWAGIGVPPPPPDSIGLREFVIRLPNVEALSQVVDRVRQAGIDTEETDEGLLVRDPSRNGIVLAA